MNYLLKVTVLGLISGIAGTGIGGLAAFFIKNINNRVLSFILEFSAGLMTAVVCFELIPEAFEQGGILTAIAGILAGIGVVILIDNHIRKNFAGKNGLAGKRGVAGRKGLTGAGAKTGIKTGIKYRDSGLLRAGILMAIGIALHNFPEGVAVGSGFQVSAAVGITITAVIIIHDIPEGIAMAVPMKAGGFSGLKSFLYTILSGAPMGLGALLGAALGEISTRFISACLGFAAGAMLYIIFGELIPESKRIYLGRLSSLGNIIGVLCGIIVSVMN